MEIKLDEVCEFNLSQIANSENYEHYELYPYFKIENGELVSDIGIDPKRIVSEFEKYGLSKPLIEERCELNELGIEVGQGIGFKKHKENSINESNKKINQEEIKSKIDVLNLDNLKYLKKIRKQEDRIRNLEEQLKTINVIKAYWWLIGVSILIGGVLSELISLIY